MQQKTSENTNLEETVKELSLNLSKIKEELSSALFEKTMLEKNKVIDMNKLVEEFNQEVF